VCPEWDPGTPAAVTQVGDVAELTRRTAADRFAELVAAGELDLPLPGGGATARRWWALARLGAADPVLARLGEGHADALAILAELGGPAPGRGQRWGVWAAAPRTLTATGAGGRWCLDGERPWCSGAGICTHALVTAAAGDDIRLFAVPVAATEPVPGTWPAVGMAGSDSRTVRFDRVPAVPVGGPEAYVDRPGFAHGAMGVAACWYGGAVGVGRALLAGARDPHGLAHLGAVDAALAGARAVLADAAATVDADRGADVRLLAARVRAVVEAAAAEVLDRTGRAPGAGPLCRDGAHAARVADLTVYLRQSHAEADLAAAGELVRAAGGPGW
jgi:hypothetical protein